jgi:uroporphyrinogen-III decarboxylase
MSLKIYHLLFNKALGTYPALIRYGYELFCYLAHDYPELVIKYMDALCDFELFRIIKFAPYKLTFVALVDGIPSSNDGLMFSPEFTEKFLYPRIKKLIQAWKSYGYYVIFFADGYKWPLIDEILSYGSDAIDPCELLANMDVKKFREKYPNSVIGQMIDCQNLLAFGTPDQVKKATLKAIVESGGAKTLISSTSEIHPEVKLENALAMYSTAKNYKF